MVTLLLQLLMLCFNWLTFSRAGSQGGTYCDCLC